MFSRAIVRPPGPNFAAGLTTAGLGAPDLARAAAQHERYRAALEQCGLAVTRLEVDPVYPDATFVEDAAVLVPQVAVLARPGAASRRGEVATLRTAVAPYFQDCCEIVAPGTLDGGDVCLAETRVFVGISARTNAEGARQLAACLAPYGYATIPVALPGAAGLLHLKSGLAWLGDGRLAVTDALAERAELRGYDLVRVPEGEAYAANCVRVNAHVLIAAGHPRFERQLRQLGLAVVPLEMSEFRKMDGGLSCLSLRF